LVVPTQTFRKQRRLYRATRLSVESLAVKRFGPLRIRPGLGTGRGG
jgi:hypothetical protein